MHTHLRQDIFFSFIYYGY